MNSSSKHDNFVMPLADTVNYEPQRTYSKLYVCKLQRTDHVRAMNEKPRPCLMVVVVCLCVCVYVCMYVCIRICNLYM